MAKVARDERSMALYEAILSLKNLDECCRFFDDLCTSTELRTLEQRYDVAALLHKGMIYADVLQKTRASSATISRVKRMMLSGGTGGLVDVIERVEKKEK